MKGGVFRFVFVTLGFFYVFLFVGVTAVIVVAFVAVVVVSLLFSRVLGLHTTMPLLSLRGLTCSHLLNLLPTSHQSSKDTGDQQDKGIFKTFR